MGTYSVSSISHSTKSPSRRSAVATDPPAVKRAKRMPKDTEGKGSSRSVDADDRGDKYDNEDNIIPATDGPIVTTAQDIAAELFVAEKALTVMTVNIFTSLMCASYLREFLSAINV